MNIFTDEMRRNPFPLYARVRSSAPVFKVPPPFDALMVLDYETVKRVMNDHKTFSSAVPAPRHWFLFQDPPEHTKLRALISRAFVPSMISTLEPRIRRLSQELLNARIETGRIDLAGEFAIPLAMMVISEMIGIPASEWERFKRWSDTILTLSYTRSGAAEAQQALADFQAVTAEMDEYLSVMMRERRASPQADLLTSLMQAEVDSVRLSQPEILGFLQLLVVGGQETTANLINNAVICFLENRDEYRRVKESPEVLPQAIEEVLRYRSPIQWMMRKPARETELHGQKIPADTLILAMIGSANHDPLVFRDPDKFDITRTPNPHLAFGHGIHSCIGAALARLEARIALGDILRRLDGLECDTLSSWPPRKALQIFGPAELPVHFKQGAKEQVVTRP